MKYVRRVPLLYVVFIVAFSSAVFADSARDRTQVGSNISVGPEEEVSEATCFGCSIRVRGHVSGDVTVFGGTLVVEQQGQIGGEICSGGRERLDRRRRFGGAQHAGSRFWRQRPHREGSEDSWGRHGIWRQDSPRSGRHRGRRCHHHGRPGLGFSDFPFAAHFFWSLRGVDCVVNPPIAADGGAGGRVVLRERHWFCGLGHRPPV